MEPISAYGGRIIGLCGGYQMLGESISDPHGIEGEPGTTAGLGLLPVVTEMATKKTTVLVQGRLGELPVSGYEIHVGQTVVRCPPLLMLDGTRPEGAQSGQVMGTYLHGLFDSEGVVEALLGPARPELRWPSLPGHTAWRETQLDALADHLRGCLDLDILGTIAGIQFSPRGTR